MIPLFSPREGHRDDVVGAKGTRGVQGPRRLGVLRRADLDTIAPGEWRRYDCRAIVFEIGLVDLILENDLTAINSDGFGAHEEMIFSGAGG